MATASDSPPASVVVLLGDDELGVLERLFDSSALAVVDWTVVASWSLLDSVVVSESITSLSGSVVASVSNELWVVVVWLELAVAAVVGLTVVVVVEPARDEVAVVESVPSSADVVD